MTDIKVVINTEIGETREIFSEELERTPTDARVESILEGT